MSGVSLVIGSPQWLGGAAGLAVLALVLIAWNYARYLRPGSGKFAVAIACALLKFLGFAALGFSLLDPLLSGSRPQPGANSFVVLVDNSQSFQIHDGGSERKRADWARELLSSQPSWRSRLAQDFDLREFVFDSHLRSVEGFEGLRFDGLSTALHSALDGIGKRFQGRPLAGIILVSDGNATDLSKVDWSRLPPIYPIVPPEAKPPLDLSIARVSLSQTNFQAAPVSIQAEVAALGCAGSKVIAIVCDEAGQECARLESKVASDKETLPFRFQLKPEKSGVLFYRLVCRLAQEGFGSDTGPSAEATLANNSRLVAVDRGGGPYRVLYVCGRPNWEFKYLRRALSDDAEVQLVGLVRVARREPKFDFRDQATQGNNPLFKGFDLPDADTAERRDQPVLIRLGTRDAAELKGGFPLASKDLFDYHAIVLDDIEAGFFTPDQQALMRQFVSRRGGGLLMLGGPDSFGSGKYQRTPVGDMLPVYLDGAGLSTDAGGPEFRLVLTREGWLQPWVRTRKTEEEETQRLDKMASFQALSRSGNAKPGASVLATVRDASERIYPALVAQPFGKGRTAALLIADLWRWNLRREDPAQDDFDRSWRQTIRWLVADVPGRVEIQASPVEGTSQPATDLMVKALDAEYLPLDNAKVSVQVKKPSGGDLVLGADPDASDAGQYRARYVPREPGAYRAVATVTGPDGAAVGQREVGWCIQPEAEEFAHLEPNRDYLAEIAAKTGGEVISAEQVASFVAGLPARGAPLTETWISPIWHRGFYFLITIGCLCAEWTIRRRFGMA